jgi:hypothetical protein
LDYFLWGHLKTVVYENPPIYLDDLKNKIIIACNELTEDQIIAATQRKLLRRMEACVENNDNILNSLWNNKLLLLLSYDICL